MIIDTNSDTDSKQTTSPTLSDYSGPTSSSARVSGLVHNPHGHVSYSTFPINDPRVAVRYTSGDVVSYRTGLLERGSPQVISDYDEHEQPPAYDEIASGRSKRSVRHRMWTRLAVIALFGVLAYSSWVSYKTRKDTKWSPNLPLPPDNSAPPGPPSPTKPPPSTKAPSSTKTPPPYTNLPDNIPLPRPPYSDLPLPGNDLPFVFPDEGRADLCRPWAYSSDGGARPSNSDKLPVDRLVYTIPSLAPIEIETSAVCPTAHGVNKKCVEYDDSSDAVSGNLQVVGGDVDLPKVELFLQHGSELGLEDVSVCLMKKPVGKGLGVSDETDHKWVFGIQIWKAPELGRNSLLASAMIKVTLPYAYTHNLTTRLSSISQLIGHRNQTHPRLLSFSALRLAGDSRPIEVWDAEAAIIEGRSAYGPLSVLGSRITQSLDLQCQFGLVVSNVTLVQNKENRPVRVSAWSEAGIIETMIDLEYSSFTPIPPTYNLSSHSRYSRASLWVSDKQGTRALSARPRAEPSILPVINLNVTSLYAIAQGLVPATYHGPVTLQSDYAATSYIDHAKYLPGRIATWWNEMGARRGDIRWNPNSHRQEKGSVYISSDFATARLLVLGLNDDGLEMWPQANRDITSRLSSVLRL